MKTVTLTLCPAFDMHCRSENFRPYAESLAEITSLDAGGKGINISRALDSDGTENIAFVVIGRDNGDAFIAKMLEYGLNSVIMKVDGRIRENITLHTNDKPETRISFRGFSVDGNFTDEVEKQLEKIVSDGDILTFTGRLPDGADKEKVKDMLKKLNHRNVKIVVDSKSFSLDDMADVGAWLIKPNEEEIAEYTGEEIKTVEKAAEQAEKIRTLGIENVMISLGKDGAVIACAEGTYHALPPAWEVVSTVGAGDSSIAGFISAFVKKNPIPQCLRTAVSYGTSACITSGTQPPDKLKAEEAFGLAVVKKIP